MSEGSFDRGAVDRTAALRQGRVVCWPEREFTGGPHLESFYDVSKKDIHFAQRCIPPEP